MKLSITKSSIEHLVAMGCTDIIVDGIKALEAEIAELNAQVEAQAKRCAESEDLILHYKQQRDEAYNDCECHLLKAEVDKLTPKKPAFFTWTDKTFIDKVEFDKLQAENERLKDELGLMHQMFEKHLTPEIRKAIIKAAKGVQS